MVYKYRRRSSTSSQTSTTSQQSASMYISFESRGITSTTRGVVVTPPSVTPPSVSIEGSCVTQCERDRCKSPTQRASALLARVAAPLQTDRSSGVVNSLAPSAPSSASSSPSSSPPGVGAHSSFFRSSLPESPDGMLESGSPYWQQPSLTFYSGGYVSFPDFEELYNADYKSDDEKQ